MEWVINIAKLFLFQQRVYTASPSPSPFHFPLKIVRLLIQEGADKDTASVWPIWIVQQKIFIKTIADTGRRQYASRARDTVGTGHSRYG